MKSRIAFALTAVCLALGLAACVAEPADEVATAATTVEQNVSTDVGTQSEEIYYRCSLDNRLWTTRASCTSNCVGGTCRPQLICKNSQGQQIPCP